MTTDSRPVKNEELQLGIEFGPRITIEQTLDPQTLPQIPTYYPTEDEFSDFQKCIEKIEQMGAHHVGLCKIVPPKNWKPTIQDQNYIKNLKVINPIIQKCSGAAGVYLQNVHQKKTLNFDSFSRLVSDLYESPPFYKTTAFIENLYWKTIVDSSPIYGANVAGSLMKDAESSFNIAKLPTIFSKVMDEENLKIYGVNTPYLYFGSWRASFPWHVEDFELYSINYIHIGAPKFWYVIPPAYARKFEALARELFKSEYLICKSFLRHKCVLIKPSLLARAGIPVRKILQKQEEIMITFPYGYHSGFNIGLNIAESTNFATRRWIDYGKRAKACFCWEDTVRINMEPFVKRYQPELYQKWLDGTDSALHPLEAIYTKRENYEAIPLKQDESKASDAVKLEETSSDNISTQDAKEREKKPVIVYSDLDLNSAIGENLVESTQKSPKAPLLYRAFQSHLTSKQIQSNSFEAEVEYNKFIKNCHPFCAVCCFLWSPKQFKANLTEWMMTGEVTGERYIPKETEPLLSQTAFSLTHLDHMRPMRLSPTSRLIQCSRCHLSVHLDCYSRLDYAEEAMELYGNNSWLCLACQEDIVFLTRPKCIFCSMSGGAIVPLQNCVDNETNQRYWAHVVCAIGSNQGQFTFDQGPGFTLKIIETLVPKTATQRTSEPTAIPVVGSSKRKQSLTFWDNSSSLVTTRLKKEEDDTHCPIERLTKSCQICGLNTKAGGLYLMKCSHSDPQKPKKTKTGNDLKNPIMSNCEVNFCNCHVHVTCAQWNGLLIKSELWPKSFSLVCNLHKEEYEKSEYRYLTEVKPNSQILALNRTKKRWSPAIAESPLINSFCMIYLLDGTYSTDIHQSSVIDIDWMKDGIPKKGSKVRVMMPGNQVKDGLFYGLLHEKWKIRFNTGGYTTQNRAEFYHDQEDIPKEIQNDAKPENVIKSEKTILPEMTAKAPIVQKRRCEMPILPLLAPKRPSVILKKPLQPNGLNQRLNPVFNQSNGNHQTHQSDEDYNPRTDLSDGKRRHKKPSRPSLPSEGSGKRRLSKPDPALFSTVTKFKIENIKQTIKSEESLDDNSQSSSYETKASTCDDELTSEPISVESTYLRNITCPVVEVD